MILAAVGLYSVVSYGVATRTNEFGIRMALGANRCEVFRLVLSSTAINVGVGLVAGIILSIAYRLFSALPSFAHVPPLSAAISLCR